MALTKGSHFLQNCWAVLLLLNGTAVLIPSPTVAQPILATTQQTKPLLEFRQQKRGTDQQLKQLQAEQAQLKQSGNVQQPAIQAKIERLSQQIANLFEPATLTNSQVIDASPQASQVIDANTQRRLWSIAIKFSTEGEKRFAELTKNIAGTGRVIGVFLNGKLISAPVVGAEYATEGITGGSAVINGNFTAEQAKDLAVQLRTQPVLTTEPDRSLRLGYDRLHAQDYQGAINYYSQAIRFSPKDSQPYLARAAVQIRMKNWRLALADYTQAIALSPKNPDLYLQRAKLYEELEEIPQAVTDYEKVIQIDPKFRSVVSQPLLIHYLELGNKSRAIALIEESFPADTSVSSSLLQSVRLTGLCLIQSYFKNYQLAIQHCSQALELNPENTWTDYFRGIAFEQTGKLQQAKRDYQQILKIDPQETIPTVLKTNYVFSDSPQSLLATAYYVRGNAHYRLNDLPEAIAKVSWYSLVLEHRQRVLNNLARPNKL